MCTYVPIGQLLINSVYLSLKLFLANIYIIANKTSYFYTVCRSLNILTLKYAIYAICIFDMYIGFCVRMPFFTFFSLWISCRIKK